MPQPLHARGLEKGAMRTLNHPIAAFIVGLCCLVGLGVLVLALTGNSRLQSSALTCAPVTAPQYGPPGARFTASFPGRVSIFVPTGVVDKPPAYLICSYQVITPKPPLIYVDIEVHFRHGPFSLGKPSQAKGETRFVTGDAKGVESVSCHVGGCLGVVIVFNRRGIWWVIASGKNPQAVRSFFSSFHVLG